MYTLKDVIINYLKIDIRYNPNIGKELNKL